VDKGSEAAVAAIKICRRRDFETQRSP